MTDDERSTWRVPSAAARVVAAEELVRMSTADVEAATALADERTEGLVAMTKEIWAAADAEAAARGALHVARLELHRAERDLDEARAQEALEGSGAE